MSRLTRLPIGLADLPSLRYSRGWARTAPQVRSQCTRRVATCWLRMNPVVWCGACPARWSSVAPPIASCRSRVWPKRSCPPGSGLPSMPSTATVPAEFETFQRRAYQLTGLDLTSYKAPQMHRRLTALMTRLRIDNFDDYARVLEADAERRQEFRDYVTINVSEFFRDLDRFGDLERRVLPIL